MALQAFAASVDLAIHTHFAVYIIQHKSVTEYLTLVG